MYFADLFNSNNLLQHLGGYVKKLSQSKRVAFLHRRKEREEHQHPLPATLPPPPGQAGLTGRYPTAQSSRDCHVPALS